MEISNGVRKKKKTYRRTAEPKKRHPMGRTALACLGIGVCLVLLCSCLSFNICDWPSRFADPHNSPNTMSATPRYLPTINVAPSDLTVGT